MGGNAGFAGGIPRNLESAGTFPLVLPVQVRPQEQGLWCWAATASMITTYLSDGQTAGLRQCDFASDGMPAGRNCCAADMPLECDRPEYPRFVPHGFRVTIEARDWPVWKDVVSEIANNRPLGLVERYPKTSHMFVALGVHELQGDRLLEIYDPASPGNYWWHEFSDYELGIPGRTRGAAYYGIRGCAPSCRTIDSPPLADLCFGQTASSTPACPALAAVNVPAASATTTSPTFASEDAAADAGLLRVPLLGQAHPESMGFSSIQAASDASKPGRLTKERVGVEDIDLNGIVNGTGNTVTVLSGSGEHYFLYLLDGKELGLITVMQRGTLFRPIAYGNAGVANALIQAKAILAQNPNPPVLQRPLKFYRARGLGQYFLVLNNRLVPLIAAKGLGVGRLYTFPQVRTALKELLPKNLDGPPF